MASVNAIYVCKNAAALTNPTSATVFQVSDAVAHPTLAACVYLPDYEGYPASGTIGTPAVTFDAPAGTTVWEVKVKGRVTPGTSGTFTLALQIGNSTTAGSNTALVTLQSTVTYATSQNFFHDVLLSYDPVSGLLGGQTIAGVQGSTKAIITPTVIAGVAISLIGAKVGLSLTALFGTSNTGNIAYLDEFSLEQF